MRFLGFDWKLKSDGTYDFIQKSVDSIKRRKKAQYKERPRFSINTQIEDQVKKDYSKTIELTQKELIIKLNKFVK